MSPGTSLCRVLPLARPGQLISPQCVVSGLGGRTQPCHPTLLCEVRRLARHSCFPCYRSDGHFLWKFTLLFLVIQSPSSLLVRGNLLFEGYSFYLKNHSSLCSFISLQAQHYKSFKKSHCCLSCSKPTCTEQRNRLQANPQVDLTSKEASMATCPSQIDEHRLELSFGSHPGAGVSTSHYPAHVLPSVITITVISTGSAMGYLHQASLTL